MNNSEVSQVSQTNYERYTGIFWAWVILYSFLAIVAIIGNGLVLIATYGKRNTGNLRYLDNAIRSLAVSDMLIGLFGVPCVILIYYYVGEFKIID
jgi:hypothetical protein